MKTVFSLLLLSLVLASAQSFAFTVEFDPCAAYRNDPRAYSECRVYLGKTKASQETSKTYICNDVNSMSPYSLEIKNENGQIKVRKSSMQPWKTPTEKVFVTKNHVVMGTGTSDMDFKVQTTCEVRE